MESSVRLGDSLHTHPADTANVKILIADDNNTDRLRLQAILEKQGHEVLVAENGIRALELFESDHPTIVLLDALMPVMDGFAAAEKIKQLAGDEFVPIIFLSGLQEADSLARCLDAGGDDFLSKPYNSIVLKAKINAFSRMVDMHRTVRRQRDEILFHHQRLLQEQEVAKRVFDKVAHAGCMDASNIKFVLSPIAVFNGDVALAGVSPSGNLLVLLGDFTGHGLNAAIGAMPLAQAFYSMLDKGFGIKDILRELNLKLHEILPVGVFCCAMVAEFDFLSKIVRVWNGGMPDAVIHRREAGEVTRVPSMHLPLGIRSGVDFNDAVDIHQVATGDRLFMWSDGIIEAEDEAGNMFGESRLFQVFDTNRDAEDLFSDIYRSVNSFVGEGTLSDDISIVEVKVVDPEDFTFVSGKETSPLKAGPRDWGFRYELRPETLKVFDPLPLMLHVLLQVPFLRPVVGQIYTVMAELYSNALEHGVLKLDSSLKVSPEGFTEYYQLRKERLQSLQEGRVTISLDYTGDAWGGRLAIDIEDSGDGFDYQRLLSERDNRDVESQHNYAGRGIDLLRSLCDSMVYSGAGNQVRAVFLWGQSVDGHSDIE